jgi:hypothetical protein
MAQPLQIAIARKPKPAAALMIAAGKTGTPNHNKSPNSPDASAAAVT